MLFHPKIPFTFFSCLALVMALTGCGAERAAPTHPLAAGWYYLGPEPTFAQRQEALGQMVDGASDHRYEDLLAERYSWGRPAVIYLQQADPGVLVQREPNRIQMAGARRHMHILDIPAGVQIVQDGDKIMMGDGTYRFSIETLSKTASFKNPSFYGEFSQNGEVHFDTKLDPGNEWLSPSLTNPRVPTDPKIVLLSQERLAAIQ